MAPTTRLPASLQKMLATRNYRLLVLLVWALLVALSLSVRIMQLQTTHTALKKESARNVALTILAARAWNSGTNGIYAPLSAEVRPNPFLHHPKRDLRTADGQMLTMINPAYMTRLISETLARETPLRVSLRSLRPLNPENLADTWETTALQSFEAGTSEYFGSFVQTDGQTLFRYMIPVFTEESCLACHAWQGDKLGAIRGGLSITQPDQRQLLHQEIFYAVVRHVVVLVLFGGAGFLLLGQLGKRWEEERESLEKRRLTEKMSALERLVQRFADELRIPLQQALTHTTRNAGDIDALVLCLEQSAEPSSATLAGLPQIKSRMADTQSALQEMTARLNSLHHASHSLGEEARALNLAQLLADILQTHAAIYRHCASVEIVCPEAIQIIGIPGMFEQILIILLTNSVEHGFLNGKRPGQIRIEAALLPGSTLLLSYADDGAGMPPERLACIFDPLPGPPGPDRKQGLSLYICYSLVSFRMGGSIRCDSLVEGGTHFLISLPNAFYPLQ